MQFFNHFTHTKKIFDVSNQSRAYRVLSITGLPASRLSHVSQNRVTFGRAMEILTGYQLFKNKNRFFFLLIFFFRQRRRTDTITKQLAYSTSSSSAHSISRLILALHTISTNTHQKADIIYQTKFTHTHSQNEYFFISTRCRTIGL